ncbi:cytochrome c3 family protein [Lyngbya confervoides]|uniref:Cytochrome c3 family protein n=1 Tax=Lyngbya confervoides BDU141951 TaxID=1574623 RepID=A0ABD4T2E9_9CYAN|nr:cytochrome c3 family protein [Lyngbya confervoides]MCM1982603.1 cytochrome c3 family protein [Lyngbya confervoides BDU141951]
MVMKRGGTFTWQSLWSLKVAIALTCLAMVLWVAMAFALDQRQIFLPGETSVGHHLFEGSCQSCHDGFKPVSNETCTRCHEAELQEDVHGAKKFRDPRWAGELSKLEVLTCTTCHNEHVHMFGRGVHLQPDLCMACHEGIITGDLQSHDGFAAEGCWTAGCHNFHDHRSISTGFLRQNLDQPPMLPVQTVPNRGISSPLDQAPAPDLRQEFLGGGT